MGTRYTFGRALEYQVKNELRAFGYFVIRSAHSEGPIDLAAFRKHERLFLQCKRNGRLDPAEWNELYHLALENEAMPLVVRKKDSGIGNIYFLLTGEKIPRRSAPYDIWVPTGPGQGGLFERTL